MRDTSRQGATLRDMSSYTLTVDDAVELMATGGFPIQAGYPKILCTRPPGMQPCSNGIGPKVFHYPRIG
jgi:hypothetical protein